MSVTSRYCIETAERIELGFGMGTPVYLSCTAFKGNVAIFKDNGTSSQNRSLHASCCQLSATNADAKCETELSSVELR